MHDPRSGMSLLQTALHFGWDHMSLQLMKRGAQLNAPVQGQEASSGKSTLMVALENGDLSHRTIEALVAAGSTAGLPRLHTHSWEHCAQLLRRDEHCLGFLISKAHAAAVPRAHYRLARKLLVGSFAKMPGVTLCAAAVLQADMREREPAATQTRGAPASPGMPPWLSPTLCPCPALLFVRVGRQARPRWPLSTRRRPRN